MPEMIVTEFMDPAPLAALSAHYELLYDPELVDRRQALESLGAACRALIVRNRTRIDRELLAAFASLQVIGRLGVGLETHAGRVSPTSS